MSRLPALLFMRHCWAVTTDTGGPGDETAGVPLSALDDWLVRVAAGLRECDRAGQLPMVSSVLSGLVTRLNGSDREPTAASWQAAIELLAADYQRALARLFGATLAGLRNRDTPARVLSLCTGYDAAVELLALKAAVGGVEAYVSVDHDPQAAPINRRLMNEAGEGPFATATFLQGDVRDEAFMSQLPAHHGPFDIGLVMRPPVLRTRYGDRRRAGHGHLSETVHEPVILELFALKESGTLDMPLALIFHTEEEVAHIRRLLLALGYGDALAGMANLAAAEGGALDSGAAVHGLLLP